MSTPDYKRWASENYRTKSQNLFLTESTPASTSLKYRSCQQLDYTQSAPSGSPMAGEESNVTRVLKEGYMNKFLVITERDPYQHNVIPSTQKIQIQMHYVRRMTKLAAFH
jgi:hypothetical protein